MEYHTLSALQAGGVIRLDFFTRRTVYKRKRNPAACVAPTAGCGADHLHCLDWARRRWREDDDCKDPSPKNQLYSHPTCNSHVVVVRPIPAIGNDAHHRSSPLLQSLAERTPKNNPKKSPRNSVDARFPFRNSSQPCR